MSYNQLKIKRYPKAKRFQLVFENIDYLLCFVLLQSLITHSRYMLRELLFLQPKKDIIYSLINYTLPLTPCHCFALILFMARRKVIKFFPSVWFWFKLEYSSRSYSIL